MRFAQGGPSKDNKDILILTLTLQRDPLPPWVSAE